MPAPTDISGRKFGKLTVISKGPLIHSQTGKTSYKSWVCRCECGRTETIIDYRIPHCKVNQDRSDTMTECTHCRMQRICVVCSKPFESSMPRACCSDECHLLHRRQKGLAFYYRKIERDPSWNKRRNDANRERIEKDPEYALHRKELDVGRTQRRSARLKSDENFRENANARQRMAYAKKAKEVQARRKEQRKRMIEEMSPEQYEQWAERRREYSRIYAASRRSTPEGQRRYREYMREYLRQQNLRKLSSTGDELIRKSLKNGK